MKLATNGSFGLATSSAAVPFWRIFPSTMTPTRSASAAASSKSCVTRIVGSARSRSSSCSSVRTVALVWASSAESGSSRRSTRGLESERSGECDALSLAAGQLVHPGARQVRDPESLEQLVDGCPTSRAEADVGEHVEVGEERVLLEEVADAASLGRDVDPSPGVEQDPVVDRDGALAWPEQAGDDAQHRRLARPPTARRGPSWCRARRSAGRRRRSCEGDG